jgi:hypothetical protein
MFSMDALDMPASIYPTIDMLAGASGGSIDITPSCVNGVSSHAVSVHDVVATPGCSVSVMGTPTSI